MNTEVLVVGAGPTGLMLAVQLARRGLRPLVIDRHAAPSLESRALGVQARTLEIYEKLGIVGRALELGKRATGANMWAEGRHAARVPLGDIGRELSPYPFLLILSQDDNERLLSDALRGHGVDVQWNTELVALKQEPSRVRATLKQADGVMREVEARWVAGCDGAHSAVRSLSGISFPGAPYEQMFFVADTVISGSMAPGELNVYLWRDGFHLFFPMRGEDHWRLVGIVPPELRSRSSLKLADVLPSMLKEAGTLSLRACHWFSTYRIHHRRAERFRRDRCFLLGDAAHIHSPVGAQGMNTGLQDAYNLAWKLALVVAGSARDQLLDSYEAERLPVAKRLLATTDRAFTIVVSNRWLAGLLRTRIVPRLLATAMRFERVRRLAFLTISQTGIQYRGGPLSQSAAGFPAHGPQAGDRFPLLRFDDLHFHLVLAGQDAPAQEVPDCDGLLRLHRLPDDPQQDAELARFGIAKPSFWLLRPDGHVGLAGTRFDASLLRRYLTERLGFAPDQIGS